MCGIFGYLHYNKPRKTSEIVNCLLKALHTLEYRGYDSAGLAVDDEQGNILIFKEKGRIDDLEKKIQKTGFKDSIKNASTAISHTRWATHGPPSERNSHPHRSDPTNEWVVVHNGVISNYAELRNLLMSEGFKFESDTDTEVFVKLAKMIYDKADEKDKPSMRKVVGTICQLVKGSYAILMKSKFFPGELIATKNGSPLILGIKILEKAEESPKENINVKVKSFGKAKSSILDVASVKKHATSAEYFLSSDATAIVEHTQTVIYLQDSDLLHFKDGEYTYYSMAHEGDDVRPLKHLEMKLDEIRKGGFPFYMRKEIQEQPETLENTIRGRVDFDNHSVRLGGIGPFVEQIRSSRRLVMIACGTSYHSGVAARPIMEELTDLPVAVELASDFINRKPAINRMDTCIFISQSGETADTRYALKYCKDKNALCVGVTNVVGSEISRETNCGIHLNAGPEIGVASTKAYTSQIMALVLMALKLGEDSGKTSERRKSIIDGIKKLKGDVEKVLELDSHIKKIAESVVKNDSMLVMGVGFQFATCLEAALKIKEIAYIHTEGIQSTELKHGPLALLDPEHPERLPIVYIVTKDSQYEKAMDGLSVILTRGSRPFLLCSADDEKVGTMKDSKGEKLFPEERLIRVPTNIDCLQNIINIIPFQLLSYHIGVLRGHNVDYPRSLAKSVTV